MADDSRVLIAGQNGTATVKAVCRFLEELGCRYFMDTPLGEVYPRTRELVRRPALDHREARPLGPATPRARAGAAATGRRGTAPAARPSTTPTAWGRYCPDRAVPEHPEFFAMGKDGQRAGRRLDLHVESGAAQALRRPRDRGDSGRATSHPSLSPTDGRGYCQCPACLAQDDPKVIEPSSGTVAVSNRYADFFDAVGRQVAPACPGFDPQVLLLCRLHAAADAGPAGSRPTCAR